MSPDGVHRLVCEYLRENGWETNPTRLVGILRWRMSDAATRKPTYSFGETHSLGDALEEQLYRDGIKTWEGVRTTVRGIRESV